VPRLINILAHKAMLSAYGKGRKMINVFDVLVASNDTSSLRSPRWVKRLVFSIILVLGSLAVVGWEHLK
jgi:MSHA biogenesis protein MshM